MTLQQHVRHTGGEAEVAYSPMSVGEMIDCIEYHHKRGEEINVVGAGSNLLISSAGVDGGVVLTHKLRDVLHIDDNSPHGITFLPKNHCKMGAISPSHI